MRVAIDAQAAVAPEKTGVGHYTWNLIHHLPQADPRTTYVAWYPFVRRLQGRPLAFRDVRAPNFVERWTPVPGRVWRWTADRYELPRVEWFVRFDLLLAPNFFPPPTGAPFVVTVHDLAFRLYPETARHASDRWVRRLERAIQRARGILVPSESTKRDLLRLYPADEGRVTVTHLGVDLDAFRRVPSTAIERVRSTFGIDRPYFAFLGGIEPRKNLPRLVHAFSRLSDDVALVIAGGAVPWSPEGPVELRGAMSSLAPDARRRVILTGYVAHRDRAALLKGAVALAYPSLYEGFGLPVAEALACGTPVLTSNVSSLPEVAGEAALLVDPEDVDALTDGLRRLLEDEDLRHRLAAAGPPRAAELTWEETARKTAGALRRAAGRG